MNHLSSSNNFIEWLGAESTQSRFNMFYLLIHNDIVVFIIIVEIIDRNLLA